MQNAKTGKITAALTDPEGGSVDAVALGPAGILVTGPDAALLPGDQDEGTERDTGQQVQCGCGYAHAAVADRMAEC